MEKVKGFRCIRCEAEYGIDEARYVCNRCRGNLQVVYDYRQMAKNITRSKLERSTDYSIWRYIGLLPVRDSSKRPPVHIGWTPLYRAERLGTKLGLKHLSIKDDGRNPSGSAKDRAGAVVVVKALEKGEEIITCASTGNAASSLSCLTAALGLKTIIFVPERAPAAKVAQLLVFGASVLLVEGTYDDAFDLCLAATEEYGWYNRNTGYNPYTREGKKTLSFEICEQLGWRCPDKVFVPVGDGNMISGVWKGFIDLFEIGLIERLPQLVACQSERSDAVKRAFESDGVIRPVEGDTIADSISVRLPRDGYAALKAIRESKGFAVSVTDEEILGSIPELATQTSIFGEPAGVAPLAVLSKALDRNMIREDETVVLLVTGNGLKDVDAAMKSAAKPQTIRPEISELKRIVSKGFL